MTTTKTLQTVWNHRSPFLESLRLAVIAAYKNNEPLAEEFTDMFTFRVYETDKHINLIIDFI